MQASDTKASHSKEIPAVRLLLVTGSYPPMADGVGDYTQKFFHELSRQLGEENVSLITSRIANPVEKSPRIYYAIKKWNLCGTARVLKILKKSKPDIVNIQYQTHGYKRYPGIAFLPWFIRLLLPQMRIVATIHEFSTRTLKGRVRLLISMVMSHRIIIVNRIYEQEIASYVPFLRKKLRYIPVGANLLPKGIADPLELARLRETKGFVDSGPVICYFGIIRDGKGLEFLLHAFSIVVRQVQTARLLLIGHADIKYFDSRIKAAIETYRLDDHVILTGRCNELELTNYFALADICVLPYADGVSTRRGSFMVGMQYGLPIITTRPKDSFKELVDWHNIVLVQYGDTKALADRIMDLLENESLREKLRTNISRLRDTFSWKRIVEGFLKVCNESRSRRR